MHDWKIVLMLLGSVERRLNLKLRLQMSGCLATLNVGSSVERLGAWGDCARQPNCGIITVSLSDFTP